MSRVPLADLDELLNALFLSEELRRFLARQGWAAKLVDELPGESVSKAALVHQSATLLQRRGLVGGVLFDALRVEFPHRKADIDAVEALTVDPTALRPHDAVLDAYLDKVRSRADLLADALCVPGGPDRISMVYVEVRLAPEDMGMGLDREGLNSIRRVEDALAHPHRRWSLVGEAGTGKSTLLHQVTLTLAADPDGLLPLPLRVPDLLRNDSVRAAVTRVHGELYAELVAERVSAGRAVLLLDGFDEAMDVNLAREGVRALSAEARRCPVLIASRPEGYSRPAPNFVQLRLRPLGEIEQCELLLKLGIAEADAEHALTRLRARPRLRAIAESPLLLTLVAALLRQGCPLPERRSSVYADAIPLILEGKYRIEGERSHPDPEAALDALSALAMALHGGYLPVFPVEQVLSQLREHRRWNHTEGGRCVSEREALAQLVRTGLLVPSDPPRCTGFIFPHRSFGEFFAARALAAAVRSEGAEGRTLGEILTRARLRREAWTEVLALTTGLLDEDAADKLVQRIIRQDAPNLLLRVIAEAEVLRPETFTAALKVEQGWDRWSLRKKLLEGLPERLRDPAGVVELVARFVQSTRDGNDLYWAREALVQIKQDTAVNLDVRRLAALAEMRIFEHIPAMDCERARMLMKPHWRTIPAGSFQMANNPHHMFSIHTVTIASPFAMLNVPVTWEMYRQFDPAHEAARHDFMGKLATSQQDQVPVYNVTWYAATMFAAWVGARLPLEPEWEYAFRAGAPIESWRDATEKNLTEVGWNRTNSAGHPHGVAGKPANPWGLYDMHGNVSEWCRDLYTGGARKKLQFGLTVDPVTASYAVGENASVPYDSAVREARRALRGGSFNGSSYNANAVMGGADLPSFAGDYVGFRLVGAVAATKP